MACLAKAHPVSKIPGGLDTTVSYIIVKGKEVSFPMTMVICKN